jgi:hypothetical protein
MRRAARERFRVYAEDEFFAAADAHNVVDVTAGDRRRVRVPGRLAGLAVLVGAVAAVAIVVAVDALPPAGGSRRRGTAMWMARVRRAPGAGTPSLDKARHRRTARLPRALARQSHRTRGVGAPARTERRRIAAAARQLSAERSRSTAAESGFAEQTTAADRHEPVSNPEQASSAGNIPTRAQRVEFGFER